MKENNLITTENNFAVIVNDIMNGDKSLSYSALSQFLKSPKHFKESKLNKEVTKAMEEGKIFHMACLEPEKFKAKYWVLDDSEKCLEIGGAKPRATKLYKEWLSSEVSNHPDQIMLSQEDYDTYMNMSNALKMNSATKDLIANLTDKEKGFEFEHDGFKIRGFIDGVGLDDRSKYIIDLKKAADADWNKNRWDVERKNLDMQGGLYSKKEGVDRYYLIYIDKGCNITVVQLTPERLEKGFEKFEFALGKFQECAETNGWNSSYEFYNNGLIQF